MKKDQIRREKELAADIVRAACEEYGVHPNIFFGNFRRAPHIRARVAAILAIKRALPHWPEYKIAYAIKRDRTTVKFHLGLHKGKTPGRHTNDLRAGM